MSIPEIPDPCVATDIPTALTLLLPISLTGYFSSHPINSFPLVIHSSSLQVLIGKFIIPPSELFPIIFLSLRSIGSMLSSCANSLTALSSANVPCVAPYPLSAPPGTRFVYTVLPSNFIAGTSL